MQDIDNGYKKIVEELNKFNTGKVIIYIDDKAIYPNGMKVDIIAMLMEYGEEEFDVAFPARPFFRSAFDPHIDDLNNLMEKCVDKITEGNLTARKAFEKLGKEAVKYVKESIMNGYYAPLAESTVKAKGSDKPLYDTGTLVRSVKYKIE